MKNIYLALLIIIALAVFILGMVIFVDQKRNPQTANPQTETTLPQVETTQPQRGEQGAVEIVEIESTEQAGQGPEVVVSPLPSPKFNP